MSQPLRLDERKIRDCDHPNLLSQPENYLWLFLNPSRAASFFLVSFDDDFSTLTPVSRGNREKGGRNQMGGFGGKRSKEEGRRMPKEGDGRERTRRPERESHWNGSVI